ncbi:MAG: hypothetical protein ACRD0H_05950 [Actinomycetes bacterium]
MRAQPAELTDAVAGVSTLDLGGGLGITDTAQDDLLLLPALAVRLRSIMDDYCRPACPLSEDPAR